MSAKGKKHGSLIIPSLRFTRMTSQEQGFHDFASPAVPLNISRQDASFSLRQNPNRSEPGNPSISVIFTLAMGAVFDINIRPAKKNEVRIWPGRDAKLTKAVNDQASCINMSRRR
ncbi:MAG TPA: hypothetical protein VMR33_03745 [Candidatus Baltobacteraceae bacterium]|jgi:hypothetical protein|nr:hypothetical protein [Candidatus Baltobacteraceae bacterium]